MEEGASSPEQLALVQMCGTLRTGPYSEPGKGDLRLSKSPECDHSGVGCSRHPIQRLLNVLLSRWENLQQSCYASFCKAQGENCSEEDKGQSMIHPIPMGQVKVRLLSHLYTSFGLPWGRSQLGTCIRKTRKCSCNGRHRAVGSGHTRWYLIKEVGTCSAWGSSLYPPPPIISLKKH